jgi:hypothetical protein
MNQITDPNTPTLRDLIDDALVYLDEMDGSEAWRIVDQIFDQVFHVLKQNNHLVSICHDRFDELTATIRERLSQELDAHLDGLVAIDDVYIAIDRVIGDDA